MPASAPARLRSVAKALESPALPPRSRISAPAAANWSLTCSAWISPSAAATIHDEMVSASDRIAAAGSQHSFATAVCVNGAWRSFDISAPSIRRHVPEPLDADAYAIIEAQAEHHTPTRREELLGPRARQRCRVGPPAGLYNRTIWHSLETEARACRDRGHAQTQNQHLVKMQQDACFAMIERAPVEYTVFARVRPDEEFFAPLPADMLRRFGANEAAMPTGDRWDGGVSDNLLVGGMAAFEVDATLWRQAPSIVHVDLDELVITRDHSAEPPTLFELDDASTKCLRLPDCFGGNAFPRAWHNFFSCFGPRCSHAYSERASSLAWRVTHDPVGALLASILVAVLHYINVRTHSGFRTRGTASLGPSTGSGATILLLLLGMTALLPAIQLVSECPLVRGVLDRVLPCSTSLALLLGLLGGLHGVCKNRKLDRSAQRSSPNVPLVVMLVLLAPQFASIEATTPPPSTLASPPLPVSPALPSPLPPQAGSQRSAPRPSPPSVPPTASSLLALERRQLGHDLESLGVMPRVE